MHCPVCGADEWACQTHFRSAHPGAHLIERKESDVNYTAEQHIYVDVEGNVVPGGSPQAVRLLLAAGDEMPEEEARRYGLLKGRLVVREEPMEEAEAKAETAAEDKAVKNAPENKSK